MARTIALIGVVALSACQVGTRPQHFAPANSAAGVRTDLEVNSSFASRVSGELLAVQDSGLLVLADSVTLVPYRLIVRAAFKQMQGTTWGPPNQWSRDRLRLVSRFPYGLAPDVLQRLLAAHRQSAVMVLHK